MNKRQLIEEVTRSGFLFTDGALRTYIGKGLISPSSTNIGVSNEYSVEHIDRIREIIAANRLGIPLLRLKEYFASADKKQYLVKHMLSNKSQVVDQYDYYFRLQKLTEEIEKGQHQELQPIELYLKLNENRDKHDEKKTDLESAPKRVVLGGNGRKPLRR